MQNHPVIWIGQYFRINSVETIDLIQRIEDYYLLAQADKVYGPYFNGNQNRKIVIVIDDQGNARTVSLPKHLMELELGRPLDKDLETIDHIDRNHDNNSLDNLRIVPRPQHSKDDTRRVRLLKLDCAFCGKPFERSPRLVRDKSKKGKVSSFCSRQCAGKYSRQVQLGLRERLPVPPPPVSEYYRNTKNLDLQSDSPRLPGEALASLAQYFLIKYAQHFDPLP